MGLDLIHFFFFTNTELAADLYCDSFYIALSNKDMILITNMWGKKSMLCKVRGIWSFTAPEGCEKSRILTDVLSTFIELDTATACIYIAYLM